MINNSNENFFVLLKNSIGVLVANNKFINVNIGLFSFPNPQVSVSGRDFTQLVFTSQFIQKNLSCRY